MIFDSKAWAPANMKDYITKSLNGEPIEGEAAGQLFKDIIYMYQKQDFSCVRWGFDKRNLGNEDNIRKYILDGVKEGKDRFAKEMGINLDNEPEKWKKFLDDLDDGLDTFIDIIPLEKIE